MEVEDRKRPKFGRCCCSFCSLLLPLTALAHVTTVRSASAAAVSFLQPFRRAAVTALLQDQSLGVVCILIVCVCVFIMVDGCCLAEHHKKATTTATVRWWLSPPTTACCHKGGRACVCVILCVCLFWILCSIFIFLAKIIKEIAATTTGLHVGWWCAFMYDWIVN